MWVQFINPHSLDQWIHCFFIIHCSLQVINSFKIQWNHLAYMDTCCCSEKAKDSPQDGCQMVEMKLNSCRIFHIIETIDLHFTYIHALFLFWFSTFLTVLFIKTIFMVISYNQDLHFKIHYRKLRKQDYNSFHHFFIL
jgi:hypothetical protein